MRGTTLIELRNMLKSLLGQTSGSALDPMYNRLLSDKQKWLADEFEWPFLEDRFDLVVPAGSRYLPFPTIDNEGLTLALNLEYPVKAEVYWSTIWQELDYGIDSEQFNFINSDNGETQDPIQRWRWSQEGEIEIWPLNVQGTIIRFTGQRSLDVLEQDFDAADLDDQLIVLPVAAELLARSKQPDASAKQALFAERFRAIKAHYPTKKNGLVFGGGSQETDREQRNRLIPIAVAGGK